MKTFIVYFQVFGKKMKTRIQVDNKDLVKKYIANQIIIDKIEEETLEDRVKEKHQHPFDFLMDVVNGKKK